jgi:uncharacterized membrane protein YeaQ/YmgE (transglycosylase-associated protein family)
MVKKENVMMDVMGWLAWITVGAVTGWLASMVMHNRLGLYSDLVVGIVGALLGGFLFNLIGAPVVTDFNIWSLFVAFIGAVVLLGALRLFSGRDSLSAEPLDQ